MDAAARISLSCDVSQTFFRTAVAVLLSLVWLAASAQPPDDPATMPLATTESLLQRIGETETSMLDAETKAKVVARYKSALQELAKINEAKASIDRFQSEANAAADNAAKYKADLEQELLQPRRDAPGNGTPQDLETQLLKHEAELSLQKQTLKDIEAARQRRTDRRNEIRRMQADAEPQLAELRQHELATAMAMAPAEEPAALTEARRLEARLRLRAFETQLSMNEVELQKHQAEESVNLLTHRENLTRQMIQREESFVKRLSDEVSALRRQEAEATLRQAERDRMTTVPMLKDIADQNFEYAEEHRRFATKIEGITREIKQTEVQLERQQAKFRDLQMKEQDIGLTGPVGLLLREERAAFPDLREMQHQLEARQELIDQASILKWKYADELQKLSDARDEVDKAAADVALAFEQRDELERLAADLLASRRAILNELKGSSEQYFEALGELYSIDHRYLQSCRNYLLYINERILWIRSADPLTPALVTADSASRQWLLSSGNWWAVLRVMGVDPFEHPFAFWPTVLAVISLFYVRLSIRPRLRALGANASKRGFLRYGPTGQAAVLTLLSSVTAPAALLLLSWRLAEGVDPTNFTRSVATAVQTCAVVLFPVELLRESCRHMGLAEAHFAWPTRAVAHLRRVLTWTKSLGIPVVFFGVLSHDHQPLGFETATERVLFIGGMLLAAVTLHRLLAGSSEFMKSLAIELPGNACIRFRHLWYTSALAVPAILALLSGLGYHYSATQVADRLIWTLWLVCCAGADPGIAVRWVVLSRRRLLLDQAYQRRAAAAAAAAEEATDANSTPKPPVIEETDVAKSTLQTRKLVDIVVLGFVAIGFAMIWAETLPAIGLLDRPLWEVADGDVAAAGAVPPLGQEAEPAPSSSGTEARAATENTKSSGSLPVTRFDLFVAVTLAIFTFLASRNLPGLMEMSILNRLPVDNATRYAATRLASYTIVIVGVLMASNKLGLRWQNVQWLAAALTVGLGFGLQEVFANFISGLIILFERPIRVGDIVTVDDVSGVVSKIRMRATTITNWDRKGVHRAQQGVHHRAGAELDAERRGEPHHDQRRCRLWHRYRESPRDPAAGLRGAAATAEGSRASRIVRKFWRKHAQLLAEVLPSQLRRTSRHAARAEYANRRRVPQGRRRDRIPTARPAHPFDRSGGSTDVDDGRRGGGTPGTGRGLRPVRQPKSAKAVRAESLDSFATRPIPPALGALEDRSGLAGGK